MLKKEFILELNGIIGTIRTYTRNPFMMGYTEALKDSVECNDYEMMQIVLDKVIDWYNDEIEKIANDDFVINKSNHEKAYGILRAYRAQLQS